MLKKLLFSLLFVVIVTSCGTSQITQSVKKLELGMTKKETIRIMGNEYDVIAAKATPEGNIETIAYSFTKTYEQRRYIISFLDNKLVEWHEELPHHRQPPIYNNPPIVP